MVAPKVGDWVVDVSRAYNRRGQVVGIYHADGSPPYLVRWCDDGRAAMFEPGVDTEFIPAGPTTLAESTDRVPAVRSGRSG